MKKRSIYNYVAVFDPAEEGGFNVSFPALPGCVTFGKTFEQAREKAREVLELWLEELFGRNGKVPIRKSRPILDEIEVSLPAR